MQLYRFKHVADVPPAHQKTEFMISSLFTQASPHCRGGFLHLRSFAVAFALAMTVVMALPASAQLTGRQSEGSLSPIPIAIPEFVGDNPKLAIEISNVVANERRFWRPFATSMRRRAWSIGGRSVRTR